ncbi:hypothetical protein [Stappia sp. ICDLI1TA098]
MRLQGLALATCMAALLGGCAYAPSGTLIDALEPTSTAATPLPDGTGVAATPTTAAPSAYAAPRDLLTPPRNGTSAAAAIAAGTARAPGSLLSADEAAAQRNSLVSIARSRGGPAGPGASMTAGQLEELRATHGNAAIREIEAAAGD